MIPTEVSTSARTKTRARPVTSTSDSSEDGRFLPGTLLGDRYRIISLLGAGGMGEVYRATDLRLGQAVALKFLPEEMALDAKALARFHNEVRIARQVGHANVCRVYDLGEVEGLPYLSMEYVDGEDLHSLLRRIGRLPSDKALEIARKLCAGLSAAHDKGVLHLDLKPANIMIDGRGHVLITDFGLAGVMGQIEGAEARNGTPGYMAPEQLTGKEVSVQSDIYALGVVLYEMFTGKRPFQAATRAELVKLSEEGMPPAPRMVVKDIDPAVESVILRCLAPDPKNRPVSAMAVLGALPGGDPLAAALAAGETPSPEMVAASGQKVGLKPAVAMGCVAGIVVGLAAFAVMNQKVNLLAKIPFDNPPEVLAKKSQEIAQMFGYTDKPASTAMDLEYRGAVLYYGRVMAKEPMDSLLAKGRPATMGFIYRSSPLPMAPRRISEPLRVTHTDPPEDVPGMVTVTVEPQGRLTAFTAVPAQYDDSKGPWPAPDWNVVFKASGLDPARFTAVDANYVPRVMADARMAWTGSYAETPDIPIRLEAAAYHGKVVNVAQTLRYDGDQRPASTVAAGRSTGDLVLLTLQLIVLIGSVPFARYNLKLCRGDTRGALRLGLFATVVCMASWVICGTHVATAEEADLFMTAVMRAVFSGITLALTYISFEPFVRRKWPETIVSWSRVLVGGFRDPLVGRDVLIGTLLGVIGAVTQGFGSQLYQIMGIRAVRIGTDPLTLLGGTHLTGQVLFLIIDSLNKSLGVLFLIFLFRTILRKQWLAAGLIVIVLAAMQGTNSIDPRIGWPVSFLFFGLLVFTLMRFGLLALTLTIFVSILMGQFPIGTDFSVWYSGAMAFTFLAVLALAAYGFRTALAGQSLIKEV